MRDMKVSSKPKSSPGRTEKFPPPLMRFLRSNVGSKSTKGRSRASPMFVRKKNTILETTQEPSSPKVTCIGQVRVKRPASKSKTKNTNRPSTAPARNRHCRWVKKVLFFHRKIKPRSCLRLQPVWRKWVLFFRFMYCGKADIREDSSEESPNRRSQYEQNSGEVAGEDEEAKRVSVSVSISSSPPKNAFLLTRCRSAPYRSSSLASRFWESPMAATSVTVTEEREDETKKELEEEEEREIEIPNSRTEKELEGSINGRIEEEEKEEINGEELKVMATGPLILTRCKSEPARTGDKLMS